MGIEPGGQALSPTLLEAPLTGKVTVALGRRQGGEQPGPAVPGPERDRCELLVCSDARSLVSALGQGRAQAAVRGDLPAGEVKRELEKRFDLKPCRGLDRAVLLELAGGLRLVGPVGIDEGQSLPDRLRLAEKAARFMEALGHLDGGPGEGWRPRLAVLALGRPEDGERSQKVRDSLEQGEALTAALTTRGHRTRHYAIEIERAAVEADILITPDGTHGNLIFRSLHYLGGLRAWGAPALALWPEVVYIDSSRARVSFREPLGLAARLGQGP